ncbi:MAG: glycosyltransferase [Firmicutes bacterium]|nr:glycosyltransferase [Bacillota bacterium]
MDYVLLTRHLRKLNVPFVCEFNTVLDAEYTAKGKRLRGVVLSHYQAKTAEAASGWLPVTSEIKQWVQKISGVIKPWILASNGFSPEVLAVSKSRCQVREKLGVAEEIPVITMLGYGGIAHGYDRAIEVIANLDFDAELWLVGADESNARKANLMAKEYGVQSLVRTFPWMRGERMANLISAADIGLGPLAMDRKKMREGQPLKVRTYLGLGLKVVINYIDPELPESLPFVTYVRSNDPQKLAKGIRTALFEKTVGSREIKRYAEENVSWYSISKRTAHFIDAVLKDAEK